MTDVGVGFRFRHACYLVEMSIRYPISSMERSATLVC